MKTELRFGHPCIAWDEDENDFMKGVYIRNNNDQHLILPDGRIETYWFQNVKLDLSGQPINGDEVECKDDLDKEWEKGVYVGIGSDGRHVMGAKGGFIGGWHNVRYPQQSKRDQLIASLNLHLKRPNSATVEDLADEILKITENR